MPLPDCYETLIAPVSVELGAELLPVAAGESDVFRRFILLKVGVSMAWTAEPM